jgi:hypothetical protein
VIEAMRERYHGGLGGVLCPGYRFEDPFGNEWSIMTHIKDVSEKEMKKAMAQMASGG